MTRIPDHWVKAMKACGFTHRGQPSISKLADRAGLSIETTRRLIYGIGTPSAETVAKAKKALRGAPVEEWVGMVTVHDIYIGPTTSRLLDARQRAALTELINAMVAPVAETETVPAQLYELYPGAEYYDLAADSGHPKQADLETDYDPDNTN